MEYILVTGYAGYIGSHICKELKNAGYGVIGIDQNEPDDWNTYAKYVDYQYEWDYSDIRTFHALTKHNVKTVIHTAATSLVGPSVTDPESYYNNNVDNMHTFMRLLRDAGVKRIVYSSSAATYGDSQEPFVETMPLQPMSPYGKTKLVGEWLIQDYCRAYNMEGVALRYFNVCGADLSGEFGQRTKPSHIISMGLTRALHNKPMTINGDDFNTKDGTCERDYVHVVDVAKANVAAITAQVDQFIAINIGNGVGYSNLQIVEAINEYSGHTLEYTFGPARAGDPAKLVCVNSLAKDVLGWEPKYSNLKTIVESATAWHENNIS